ncbi:hypothetical protein [Leifsonia sp. Le1]|uniref:hypothetical protein n=1 Tax=Leifsonia sp. Le1 TaxID=3404918 RepID=UPI003EB9D249
MFGAEGSGNPIGDAIGGIGDAIGGAVQTANFFSDPFGNMYKSFRDSAVSLSRDVLPVVTQATMPDLTMDWFINAYKVSFGLAILVLVFTLLPQFVRVARGTQSGRELGESLAFYGPLFIIGAMFGPLLGSFLVNVVHALSTSLTRWAFFDTNDNLVASFTKMLDQGDAAGIAGGAPVAAFLMFCAWISLLMAIAVMLVLLVVLYFAGVLFPLGYVWIIDPQRRKTGWRLVGLFIGVMLAHPLLFFMLGVTFHWIGAGVETFGDHLNVQRLALLISGVLAMLIATLSPMLLMKFAPVIPASFGGSNGPSIQPGQWGSNNMQDATQKYAPDARQGGKSTDSANAPSPAEDAPAAKGSGGLGDFAGAGAKAGKSFGMEAGAGAEAGAAGAGAGAGAAGAGAGGLAAAGAAESATGVGAAIGVPTLIAAGAMAAGQAAVDKAQEAGAMAADAADSDEGAQ